MNSDLPSPKLPSRRLHFRQIRSFHEAGHASVCLHENVRIDFVTHAGIAHDSFQTAEGALRNAVAGAAAVSICNDWPFEIAWLFGGAVSEASGGDLKNALYAALEKHRPGETEIRFDDVQLLYDLIKKGFDEVCIEMQKLDDPAAWKSNTCGDAWERLKKAVARGAILSVRFGWSFEVAYLFGGAIDDPNSGDSRDALYAAFGHIPPPKIPDQEWPRLYIAIRAAFGEVRKRIAEPNEWKKVQLIAGLLMSHNRIAGKHLEEYIKENMKEI
jgi:hypothetical protein